jgi:hypothetical protein
MSAFLIYRACGRRPHDRQREHTMTRLVPRGLIAGVAASAGLALAALIAGPGLAMAAPAAPAAAQGWARFGHFAPSAAPVDVLVDGQPFVSDVAFKSVSNYEPLDAGLHHFELHASSDPTAAALLSVDVSVPAAGAITIGAVTTLDGVAPQIYDDALATPQPGQASVRFIHSAPDVQAVDVQVIGGPLLASDVPYPTASGYEPITPGQYDVNVLQSGTTNVVLHIAGWSIQPDTQASIVIVKGLDGKLDVVPVRDSAATTVTPVGGVQTGYGGMADVIDPPKHGTDLALIAAIGGIAIVGAGSVGFGVRRWVRARAR